MTTYYEILGISPDAPTAQIRAKYRLLVRNVHPDVASIPNIATFSAYTEAYRTLSDPLRRREYNEQIGIFANPRTLLQGQNSYQRVFVSPQLAREGGNVELVYLRYEPCSRCWLEGCERCNGEGFLPEHIHLWFSIPPNTLSKSQIFIEGQGVLGEPGGQRGDLIVYVYIKQAET